jgi:hypothetical protein
VEKSSVDGGNDGQVMFIPWAFFQITAPDSKLIPLQRQTELRKYRQNLNKAVSTLWLINGNVRNKRNSLE